MAIEIERTFLLRAMPDLPPGARADRLRQGYLPEPGAAPGPGAPAGSIVEGRVRQTTAPDGSVCCTHTIKHGTGIRRVEIENEITPAEFDELWERTAGRRIVKTRHVVALEDGSGLEWVIDAFETIDLVLAEIELPAEDTPVAIPPWLAPQVEREVTDEPAYRNYALALRAGAAGGTDSRPGGFRTEC